MELLTMPRLRALLLSLLALPLVAACSESTAPSMGRVTILLTDAPGEVKKAVVTIDQIYLQVADDEDDDGPPGGRTVLRDEDLTVDLLTLAGSTAEIVEDVAVRAGRYSQLRFVISGGFIEVENDEGSTTVYASSPTYAGLPLGTTAGGVLQMPSFAETGIKVILPNGGVEVSDGENILLVDFDVSRSFGKRAGFSGMWVMHPVVFATEFSAGGTS